MKKAEKKVEKKVVKKSKPKTETCPANACQVLQDLWLKGGGAYNATSKYCRACGKDFPETKAVCESRTLEAKAKAVVKKSPGKSAVEKVGHGHRKGTQAACIDLLLEKGATKQQLIDGVNKAGLNTNSLAPDAMWTRIARHIDHLNREHGVKINRKDGVYKG